MGLKMSKKDPESCQLSFDFESFPLTHTMEPSDQASGKTGFTEKASTVISMASHLKEKEEVKQNEIYRRILSLVSHLYDE